MELYYSTEQACNVIVVLPCFSDDMLEYHCKT